MSGFIHKETHLIVPLSHAILYFFFEKMFAFSAWVVQSLITLIAHPIRQMQILSSDSIDVSAHA